MFIIRQRFYNRQRYKNNIIHIFTVFTAVITVKALRFKISLLIILYEL